MLDQVAARSGIYQPTIVRWLAHSFRLGSIILQSRHVQLEPHQKRRGLGVIGDGAPGDDRLRRPYARRVLGLVVLNAGKAQEQYHQQQPSEDRTPQQPQKWNKEPRRPGQQQRWQRADVYRESQQNAGQPCRSQKSDFH